MIIVQAEVAIIIPVGVFVDKTDGFTPETGITLGGTDTADLFKFEGATATGITSNTWTERGGGMYYLTLTKDNLDAPGFVVVIIRDDSVFRPVRLEVMVIKAEAYDSLVLGTYLGAAPDASKHSLEKLTSMIKLIRNEQITRGRNAT